MRPIQIEELRAIVSELLVQRPRVGTILSFGGAPSLAKVKVLDSGQVMTIKIPRGMQATAVVGDTVYLMYFNGEIVGFPWGVD